MEETIMGSAFMHGWVSLPTQGEMYLDHGVPREVRLDGHGMADVERMADEIVDVTGLRVTFGRWEPVEDTDAMQAEIHVAPADMAEVMRRLALASAETFFDRYHKPIGEGDTDFDDEAYAQDFNVALDVCGLHWSQVNMDAMRDAYRRALHGAAERMART
jgi:hypothetical protein